MAYAKKWVPPTMPLRDDLPAWKTLFTDLHDNLIAAGLVQTATAGQLDFDDVVALPASGSFAGFREYAFDDALQAEAPVVIELKFGVGDEAMASNSATRRGNTPRIQCSIFFNGGGAVASFSCPQGYGSNGAVTTQPTSAGFSVISHAPELGFLGVVYGAGSRNRPATTSAQYYIGATFTLFVQRSLSDLGEPTADGLLVYHPDIGNTSWTGDPWAGVLPRSKSVYSAGFGVAVSSDAMGARICTRGDFASSVDKVMLEPIWAPASPPIAFPFIYSYYYTHISELVEFEFQPIVGPARNFIALGRETCMSIDSVDGQRAGIAMLFEND